MASAEELFGAGAGRAAGLEAWRIESMKPASNAEAARGRFHEGGRAPPPPPRSPLAPPSPHPCPDWAGATWRPPLGL